MTLQMYTDKQFWAGGEYISTLLIITPFNAIDLPLCLATDTILLPFTAHNTFAYTKEEREEMIGVEYKRRKEEKRKRRLYNR